MPSVTVIYFHWDKKTILTLMFSLLSSSEFVLMFDEFSVTYLHDNLLGLMCLSSYSFSLSFFSLTFPTLELN